MTKYKLTEDHRAQLKPWADRWIANAMSTRSIRGDEGKIREAVNGLYDAAKLPRPKHIVFVPSPFVLAFAGGFAAAIWHKRSIAAVDAATRDATVNATAAATDVATVNAVDAATYDATYAATSDAVNDATDAATYAATRTATNAATAAATRAATFAAVDAATNAAVNAAVEVATDYAVDDATYDATVNAVEAATYAATDAATYVAINAATNDAVEVATNDATDTAVEVAIYDAVDDATYDATVNAVDAAAYDATFAAVNAAVDAATYDATVNATYDAVEATTRAAVDAAVDAAGEAATDAATDAATYAATFAAVNVAARNITYAATTIAIEAAVEAAVDDTTYDAIDAATCAAVDDATYDAVEAANWYFLREDNKEVVARLKLGRFGLECAKASWKIRNGGNQWSGYVSFLSFFRHVAKLPLDYNNWAHYETLAELSGPRLVHKDFCMISDRPEVLKVDDQNRPNCDDGPFCRWRDGSALYAVHGVRVPAWIIERPELLTTEKIDAETNAEVRRVMVDRYGLERYMQTAQVIHTDDWGTLLRKEQPNDEVILMVKVVNSTPEADGTFKDYFIQVHPELRPLLDDSGKLGEPQELTAHNAVASTFGMRGCEYAPLVET